MAVTIKIKRGTSSNLPALNIGELGFASDTEELYIGSASGNLKIYPPSSGGGGVVNLPTPIQVALFSNYTLTKAGTQYVVLSRSFSESERGLYLCVGTVLIKGGSANTAFRATATLDMYWSADGGIYVVNHAVEGACGAMGSGVNGYITLPILTIISTTYMDESNNLYYGMARLRVACSLANSIAMAAPGDYSLVSGVSTKLRFIRIGDAEGGEEEQGGGQAPEDDAEGGEEDNDVY